LGQSVDFVVSITFLRSPVFAILAIGAVFLLHRVSLHTRAKISARGFNGRGHSLASRLQWDCAGEETGLALSSLHERRNERPRPFLT
jgi:hypothetical protein